MYLYSYKANMSVKIKEQKFKKINETTVELHSVTENVETLDCLQSLEMMTKQANQMRQMVAQANQLPKQFWEIVARWNRMVKLLNDANKEVKLAITVPEPIELPNDFDLTKFNIKSIPTVKITNKANKEDVNNG